MEEPVRRRVPFLNFVVSPVKKAYINLAGCNFNCKYCFAIAKNEVGQLFSVRDLLNLFSKSCKLVFGEIAETVTITGGEPTLNPDYLLDLIKGLRSISVRTIAVSTNGYLLTENFIARLKAAEIDLIKLDIKAFTDEIHQWYTGTSNHNVLLAAKLLHESGLDFYVRTIFMPNIIEAEEIGKIARFLSHIDRDITYRIYQLSPEHTDSALSRPPKEEMLKAFNSAKRYLNNVEVKDITDTSYSNAKYVEIRDEELLDKFNEIDKKSTSLIQSWDIHYRGMSEVLGEENAKAFQ
jgi:pyruvate formate lyase activating enzyme